ncbi:MFS transporter [Phytoactinopolyspora limicola]|uniref:MFS transporter n=1 Tax=Phytoactinopolyspora limicola TaxID=2715536 RepID=UPI00140C09B9|nr:MFS transporter [Phytoactinopolyspora limicola]
MTHPEPAVAAQRTIRRPWIGLAVLALPAFLASLELTVVNLALPSIGRDLAASSTQLLWIVDVYAFLLAGSLIAMGALGDRIGRRRILLFGVIGYGITSALAAYSTSPDMLIAARALMGLAGATLMPSILALVSVLFPVARQRATAIGVVVASVSGGTALGPLIGGWLLDRFWWGSAFLLAVPVMVVLLVLIPLLLPESRDRGTKRIDVVSAALSVAAVLPVVYGLKQLAADGVELDAVLAIVVGIAAGVAFIRRQRTMPDPFVDLSLFGNRAFAVAAGTLAVGIFVLWGSNYAIAVYLQLVQGLSPLDAGLWTAPPAAGVILGSTVAPRIARRVSPTLIIAVGLVVSAIGYGVLTQVSDGPGGLAVVVTGAIIVAAGLGPMMALATDMVIGAAPPDRAGAAAAISATAPQLGGALGIAVIGSTITAVYRSRMADLMPADTTPDVVEAVRDSLSSALTATAHLPEPLASTLVSTARQAFSAGFQVAAGISAIVMIGMSALLLFIRGRRRTHGIDNDVAAEQSGRGS